LYYSRKRLWVVYGLGSPSGSAVFYERNPWRQAILMALAGSIILTSVPTEAYAGTPVYDPVFYYYHPDNLGSSQLMTDRDGDVVQQYGYRPFGNENYHANTQAFSVSNRYTGQTLDEETGLYYYGARYYDPELARFIQADSLVPNREFSQAYNRYAYCYNNPLKFTDPTGQFVFAVAWFIIQNYLTTQLTLQAIIVKMAVGAAVSVAMGGSPLQGALSGLIGAVGNAIHPLAAIAMNAATASVGGKFDGAGFVINSIPHVVRLVSMMDPGGQTEIALQEENVSLQQASTGNSGAGGTSSEGTAQSLMDTWLGGCNNDPSDVPIVAQPETVEGVRLTEWQHVRDQTEVSYEYQVGWRNSQGGNTSVSKSSTRTWELNPKWKEPPGMYSKIRPGQKAESLFVKYRITERYAKWSDGTTTLVSTSKTAQDIYVPGHVAPFDFRKMDGTIIPWKCDVRDYFSGPSQPKFEKPQR
jgi:RHS repeat-associated protein